MKILVSRVLSLLDVELTLIVIEMTPALQVLVSKQCSFAIQLNLDTEKLVFSATLHLELQSTDNEHILSTPVLMLEFFMHCLPHSNSSLLCESSFLNGSPPKTQVIRTG
jgi:hypothetical protein